MASSTASTDTNFSEPWCAVCRVLGAGCWVQHAVISLVDISMQPWSGPAFQPQEEKGKVILQTEWT